MYSTLAVFHSKFSTESDLLKPNTTTFGKLYDVELS